MPDDDAHGTRPLCYEQMLIGRIIGASADDDEGWGQDRTSHEDEEDGTHRDSGGRTGRWWGDNRDGGYNHNGEGDEREGNEGKQRWGTMTMKGYADRQDPQPQPLQPHEPPP